VDFSFAAPMTVRSGTMTFRLVNDGKQLHHLQIVRLAPGLNAADFMRIMQRGDPQPDWATDVGGPNAAVPGAHTEATVTLEPGTYVLTCMIPSPSEERPHLMKGMVRELTVVGPAKVVATEPKPDLEARLTDFKFTMSKPIVAGRQTVRVTNDAAQPHELTLFRLMPGKSVHDMATWAGTGMQGPPPGTPIGGVTALAHGRSASFDVNLLPGNYGLICFIPDAKDRKPHLAHGMVDQFTVPES
jgi:uncharacterized cupredoxin-like copper-binding protein